MEIKQHLRVQLINGLAANPRQTPTALIALHRGVAVSDPGFYARFATWSIHGPVTPEQRRWIAANLLAAESPQLRALGAQQLSLFKPADLSQIVNLLKSQFGKIPRSTRTAVTGYLRRLEMDHAQFDLAVLHTGKALKHLYAGLRIKPSARADNLLFKKNPPEDSLQYGLKALTGANAQEQADLILNRQIPYQAAAGVMSDMDPVVLALLIAPMTAAEIKTRMRSLKAHGAMEHAGVRAIIRAKQNKTNPNSTRLGRPDQIMAEILAVPDPFAGVATATG